MTREFLICLNTRGQEPTIHSPWGEEVPEGRTPSLHLANNLKELFDHRQPLNAHRFMDLYMLYVDHYEGLHEKDPLTISRFVLKASRVMATKGRFQRTDGIAALHLIELVVGHLMAHGLVIGSATDRHYPDHKDDPHRISTTLGTAPVSIHDGFQ